MSRRGRIGVMGAAMLAVCLGVGSMALAAVPAGAAEPTPAQFHDFKFASTSAPPSADKPQSKLWFQDGAWWGILLAPGGGIHVFELTNHVWRDTGAVVDDRSSSTGDALWDGGKLYVVSRTATGVVRVNRLSYVSGTRSYSVDAGFPVQVASGGPESATIARDTAGILWVTYTLSSKVWITHSSGGDTTWTTPVNPPVSDTSITGDDISSIIAWNGRVGVFWSDQGSSADRLAIHVDGTPDTQWSFETPLSGTRMADDHINMKAIPGDPRLFVVVKTSRGDSSSDPSTDPLDILLVRAADGSWTRATFATVADDTTRAQVVLDATNRRVYVMGTAPTGGGKIYFKSTSLDAPTSFASGRGTILLTSSSLLNNVSSTKQPITSTSGLVAIATSSTDYFHAEIGLPTGPAPDTTAPSVPQNLQGTATGPNTVNLAWNAATDNVGVTGYTVYRGGAPIGTAGGTTFTDTTAPAGTTSSYAVDAFDAAGNHSARSAAVNVTTPTTPPPPPPPPPPSGSIAFHGASYASNPTATTLTVAPPATAAAGDVLLAAVSVRGQPTVTAPAGWTLVRHDQNSTTMGQWVFVKVAGAGEPAATFTLSSSQAAAGGILAYAGVNTASPIDASGGSINGSSSSIAAPSITTTVAGDEIVGLFGIGSNTTIAPPADMTEHGEAVSNAGTYKVDSESADVVAAAAGATGPRTATAAASAASIGQLIALRPA